MQGKVQGETEGKCSLGRWFWFTKALYTDKRSLFLSEDPSFPAVLLIEAFSLLHTPPQKKTLANMLCEISELIRPNGAHICHWFSGGEQPVSWREFY